MYAIPSEHPWSIDDVSVEGFDAEYGPRVRFRFHLRPPSSQSSASVRLEDDIIVHEVKSHYTVVYVRRDFSTGIASDSPRLVGTVHASQKNVLVQRDGSFCAAWPGWPRWACRTSRRAPTTCCSC